MNIKSTKDQNKFLYEDLKASSTYQKSKMKKLEEKLGTEFVIKLKNKTKKSVKEAIEILEKNDNVDYAMPNYILKPAATPNDTSYSKQWGMNRIQAPEAWDTYTGSSTVTVGIIDSGIDSNHPDLSGNINTELAYNVHTNTAGIANTMDGLGHGTHVAGIVGAKGNNAYGVTGVNWNVSMVPIKISYDDTTGHADTNVIINAINYAKNKGIKICNMSYSFPPGTGFLDAVKEYGNEGGLLIMSAGNDGENVDNIDKYAELNKLGNVIFVASSDTGSGENEKPSGFSNYGTKNVQIAAPGDEIYSTVPVEKGSYGNKSGTSMAAPHVTGVAALIKGKYPNLTTAEIKEIILSSADYSVGMGERVLTGRLNAYRAINRIPNSEFLVVQPNDGESMSDAIRRCLGTKSAESVKYLKIVGDAIMADVGDNTSSANAVLPNLTYVDCGGFGGILGDRAFANCRKLETVLSPENNFRLRACSFWYCTKLKTIYKANSKSRVEGEADFTGMISASLSGSPDAARTQCFQGCTSLTTIRMPNAHKVKFAIYAFNGCSNLSTIYLDGYPKVVGEADLTEFANVSEGIVRGTAIKNVKLPKNIAISKASFENCASLTNIQFHPNQTVTPVIGQNAFRNVNSACVTYTNQLVNGIVIPRTDAENIPIKVNSLVIQPVTNEIMGDLIVESLDSENSKDIKHLVVKGSAIMRMGASVSVLPNLETADLSEFTGELAYGTFFGCSNLKQVIYSKSNKKIPSSCFMNCGSLQTIQIADKYPKLWGEIDLSNISGSGSLGTQAFAYCSNIETVKLPSSGTIEIGSSTFSDCSKLSTIYRNKKIKRRADLSGVSNFIGNSNFKNAGFDIVMLPKNVNIPKEIFMNCTNLYLIEFDKSQTAVVNIGERAFYNVRPYCVAHMNQVLVQNSEFILPRSATENIPKGTY